MYTGLTHAGLSGIKGPSNELLTDNIRESNSLDPDQTLNIVGSDLGPSC